MLNIIDTLRTNRNGIVHDSASQSLAADVFKQKWAEIKKLHTRQETCPLCAIFRSVYDTMQAKGTFATHLRHKISLPLSHICTFPFISFGIRGHLIKKLMQNVFYFNTA